MKTSIDLTLCNNVLFTKSSVVFFLPEIISMRFLSMTHLKRLELLFTFFLSLFRHLEKPERSASHFPSSAASKDRQPSSSATPIAPVKGMKKMAPAGEI